MVSTKVFEWDYVVPFRFGLNFWWKITWFLLNKPKFRGNTLIPVISCCDWLVSTKSKKKRRALVFYTLPLNRFGIDAILWPMTNQILRPWSHFSVNYGMQCAFYSNTQTMQHGMIGITLFWREKSNKKTLSHLEQWKGKLKVMQCEIQWFRHKLQVFKRYHDQILNHTY